MLASKCCAFKGALSKYMFNSNRPGLTSTSHHCLISIDLPLSSHLQLNYNFLSTQDQKKLKQTDFGLAREETVTEMMTAETGTYRWMILEISLLPCLFLLSQYIAAGPIYFDIERESCYVTVYFKIEGSSCYVIRLSMSI